MDKPTSPELVTWYDGLEAHNRRRSVQWWPNADEVDAAGNPLGRVYLSDRRNPGCVWSPARLAKSAVTLETAELIARDWHCVHRPAPLAVA